MGLQNAPGTEAYTAVGDPSDVSNVNPYTDSAFDSLFGDSGFLNQFEGQMGQFDDPLGGINSFLNGAAPQQILDLIMGATSQYGQAQAAVGTANADEAGLGTAQMFVGQNSFNSGAAMTAVQLARQRALNESSAQTLGMQTQLAGGLLNTGLGAASNAYGATGDRYAGLLGGALGQLGQFGAPEYYQPTYVENPDYISRNDRVNFWGGLFGDVIGAAGTALAGI